MSMNFKYENVGTNENGIQELFEAIGKCQYEFPALPLNARGQKGAGKFRYASLDQIIELIKPQLKQYGITIIQLLNSTERESVITLLMAGHGAVISSSFTFARDRNPQDAGSQTTYHKRYQLCAALTLVGADDADATSVEDNKTKYENKIAEEKAEKIEASKPIVIEKRDDSSDDVGANGSCKVDEQEAAAVRDDGNGELTHCDRTLGTKQLNDTLNKLKNERKMDMGALKNYCISNGLLPDGVKTLSNLTNDTKCDIIDSLRNNK